MKEEIDRIMILIRDTIQPDKMSATEALETLEAVIEEIKSEIAALKETM
jgi:hypothetical protein